jgi:exopolysaccharide biosynthesis predicted pyruvyltransferase EpsI
MILALVVGRPVIALETGYGKIDSYADTFLRDEPLLHRPTNPEDVDAILAEITKRH